ncbi:chromosomal replication initiator protein DnaA [Patescibacteria group bacterium]
MTNQEIWQATLGELELILSKANFVTWFKNTYISSLEKTKAVINVPNEFTKSWFEQKYHKEILQSLKNVSQENITEILYQVQTVKTPFENSYFKKFKNNQSNTVETETKTNNDRETVISIKQNNYGLNEKYTFETFIVGRGNEMAQAASIAVSENPGKIYNPLFIYGGVGLGKTHLMQAIGNTIASVNPKTKIIYATSETFTNDYIYSLKTGTTKDFHRKYREIDLLLIDDIQFMANKESTQEAFFHTFNDLYQTNRQIVISSDRVPKAIPKLEDRLTSRLECGMIADISRLDLETRLAILKAKCIEKEFEMNEDAINLMAATVTNNIRELEGALNKVMAHCHFHNISAGTDDIKSILASLIITPSKGHITSKGLLKTVAEFYDVNIAELLGKCRKKEIVEPRQIIMFLLREDMNYSFPHIAQELGGRDHTTAIHAHKKIAMGLKMDERIRQEIELIRQKMYY